MLPINKDNWLLSIIDLSLINCECQEMLFFLRFNSWHGEEKPKKLLQLTHYAPLCMTHLKAWQTLKISAS